ncbi:Nfrkb-like protein [Daphnia magna]|uniref:Nfrkb-like protein n=1 Tax=Daphnia magna TaxID=35525 RepID=A0A162BZB7_9CRUS|nr:Nfrkb-like protein [Daphnia magna]
MSPAFQSSPRSHNRGNILQQRGKRGGYGKLACKTSCKIYFFKLINSVNLTKNYSIIDKWMLSKRWEEEIVQTRREMIAFVTYFKDLHAKLTEDLAVQGIIVQSYTSGQKSRSNSGQTTPSWL